MTRHSQENSFALLKKNKVHLHVSDQYKGNIEDQSQYPPLNI